MNRLPIVCLSCLVAARSTLAQTIDRIVVSPAARTVQAGDSVRLTGRALDAQGRDVPGISVVFRDAGGEGGIIDSTGMLVAGSTGVMNVTAVALVPGQRPRLERLEFRLVPGPAARIELTPTLRKLVAGQRALLAATSWSRAGDERKGETIAWTSSAPNVARVGPSGLVTALAPGKATITARAGQASSTMAVEVLSAATISSLSVDPASPGARQGDVLRFKLIAKDARGRSIDGLSPVWTVTGGEGVVEQDGAFVGYQRGRYLVSASLGSRSADAVVTLADRDVRRPSSVVARLPRSEFPTAEVWLHPNGNVAYLGAHGGGDRFWTIDISNPAKPVVVDSVVMNTRLVNDVMTTEDGKYLVATREGADNRKNGIVICSLEDPLHPKVISEFTDGVTSGVHSAYVFTQPKFGTHVYLTNDGTGALEIIDINDPVHPKRVASWKTLRPDAGRYLHDVDVRDGLLYGSWWNDGLVILDIGNGIKGGNPSNPQFVSQFKYDLNDMYKEVEVMSGPGHGRGTHTAWRHKNYVFIADEVYRASDVKGAKDASASRMYGTLQVVDVSDIMHPKSVAYYKPEYGGVHNVWVAGDTLYMGVYDGGFRVFDISGELRGNLREQGREISHVLTADNDGKVRNAAFTWGVVVNKKDGLAYVNDFNNGLWVVKIEPRAVVP
jgi:hypothetical protein